MIDKHKLLQYLKKIDDDFPVKLSDKIKLEELADKLIGKGVVKYKEINQEIVGIAAGYINDYGSRVAYLSVVSVDCKYRKKGFASKLVNEFIKECKNSKFTRLEVHTYNTNESAKQLYKTLGFKVQEKQGDRIKYCIILDENK